MKRLRAILCLTVALIIVTCGLASATLITDGAFKGWDADPSSAITIGDDGVATLQIQEYSDPTTTIYLSRLFTSVAAISFEVNFKNDIERIIGGGYPNYLQVSFYPSSGDPINYLNYDKEGVYDPNSSDFGAPIGILNGDGWFSMNINDIGGITGTLLFILQDGGDNFYSQGLVRNVIVTENQPNPVPEPATLLLLGGGLSILALYRRNKSKRA